MRAGGRLLAAALAASLFGVPAQAQDAAPADAPAADFGVPAFTVSGGATLASQYRFRGVSLSDEDPALQGTINLEHRSGVYAGVFASSTDGFGELGGSNVEVDLYAGYRTRVGSALTLDAGLLYYAYPGSRGGDFEYFEPYASLSGTLGPATAKLGVAYAPDQDALGDESNVYVSGDLTAAVPTTPVTIRAHLGRSDGDTPLTPGGDYLDWSLGAEWTRGGLTVGLAYVDTDLSGAQAARGGASRDIVDAALVLSLTAGF